MAINIVNMPFAPNLELMFFGTVRKRQKTINY